jgi:hypothetical protein
VTRLYVVVEGETELEFVKRTLGPHLDARGVHTYPIEVTTKRDRRTRAKIGRGGGHFKHWQKDISILLREHKGNDVRFTTLFDLYGLPRDFPGLAVHGSEPDTCKRADLLESELSKGVEDGRFIAYLQRHEIESLVLTGLDTLERRLDDPGDQQAIRRLKESLQGIAPEDVNDGPETHPSRRLRNAAHAYQKTLHGPDILASVGVETLKARCPRFGAWVTKLEKLGAADLSP